MIELSPTRTSNSAVDHSTSEYEIIDLCHLEHAMFLERYVVLQYVLWKSLGIRGKHAYALGQTDLRA